MALYEHRRVNGTTAIYKDTNEPDAEYRLTDSQWKDVSAKDGDYNGQVALAKEYDARNRGEPEGSTDEGTPEPHRAPEPQVRVERPEHEH